MKHSLISLKLLIKKYLFYCINYITKLVYINKQGNIILITINNNKRIIFLSNYQKSIIFETVLIFLISLKAYLQSLLSCYPWLHFAGTCLNLYFII